MGPHAMGDHRRPRARGAPALRQISVAGPLANALAIPRIGGNYSARPACHGGSGRFAARARGPAGRMVAAGLPGVVRRAARSAVGAAHAAGMGGGARPGRRAGSSPRGVPWRAGGVALMAPAFALAPPAPAHGEAWITALDVGQGWRCSCAPRAALLYDAGPAYGPEADSGGRIVVPLLRASGVRSVDLLVLTHEDIDHRGRRAHRAGNARREGARFFAAAKPSPAVARLGARPVRRRGRMGLGRRALRVPASAAGLGGSPAQ